MTSLLLFLFCFSCLQLSPAGFLFTQRRSKSLLLKDLRALMILPRRDVVNVNFYFH